VPVPIVAAQICHARASTTLNVYAHALPGGDRIAAEVLWRRVDEAGSGISSLSSKVSTPSGGMREPGAPAASDEHLGARTHQARPPWNVVPGAPPVTARVLTAAVLGPAAGGVAGVAGGIVVVIGVGTGVMGIAAGPLLSKARW
jgi:hypothetical protein